MFSFNTPGLLFPAVSLLMLAYTNRFLSLASLVRGLINEYRRLPTAEILAQIRNLRLRIDLLRHVQALGISSLFLCTASMFALFMERQSDARLAFATALLLMLASLALALLEIHLSVRALSIEVSRLDGNKA